MIYKLFLILIIIPFYGISQGCSKENSRGPENIQGTLSPDDDGQPHLIKSYDYSKITPHPRLLMTKEEEKELKKNLDQNILLFTIHENIIKNCDELLNTEPVIRKMEGKRLLDVSRKALQRIFYLSYGYRMTGKSQYLVRAEREIIAVCEFSDWNPSHFLDVGEMSLGVAIGYDWLYDDLKPETRDKIRKALKSKAFEPSKLGQYNWFLTNRANWNQVCNAGLACAALAIYESDKLQSVDIIERALQTNKFPLEDYGPNGNYTEGYMYWNYGTDFQVVLLSSLETALGSDNNLHKIKGFLETAEYMLFMTGIKGLPYNYSDSSNNREPRPSMFWFARKTRNPSLLYTEKQLMENGDYIKIYGKYRLLPMVMVLANQSSFEEVSAPEKKIWVGHGTTPVALIRTSWNSPDDKYVGMKGGKAASSHAHMDAGSFVYDANGTRWATDLGMQSYAPLEAKGIDLWNMSQNSDRWNIFRLNNKSHNTLTINEEKHLVDGQALITEIFDTDARRGATIDLSPVFKNSLSFAHRTITLIDNKFLQIEDQVKSLKENAKLRWSMATPSKVEIVDSKTFRLSQNDKIMYVAVETSVPFTLKLWNASPDNDIDEPNHGTIIVGFEAELSAKEFNSFKVILSDSK